MFPTDRPSKFDKSLMDAYSSVHEGVRKGHAAGDSDVEKQASQLASDVRYKAKGKLKPGASKEQMMKVYMAVLASSPAPSAVKTLAKKKILGEQVETQPQIPPHGDSFRPGSVKNPPAPELPPAPKAKRKKPVEEQTAQDYVNRGGDPQHMGRDLPSRMSPSRKSPSRMSPSRMSPGRSPQMDSTPGPNSRDKYGRRITDSQGNRLPGSRQGGSARGTITPDSKPEPATAAPLKNKVKPPATSAPRRPRRDSRRPQRNSQEPLATLNRGTKGDGFLGPTISAGGYRMGIPNPSIIRKEELDPVGQRDGDVNDDGRKDKTDEYIYNRRDAIKRAIAKKREKSGKKVSEGYASWRMDLNYFEEEGKK